MMGGDAFYKEDVINNAIDVTARCYWLSLYSRFVSTIHNLIRYLYTKNYDYQMYSEMDKYMVSVILYF